MIRYLQKGMLLLAACLLLAGCGGAGGPSSYPTTTAPSMPSVSAALPSSAASALSSAPAEDAGPAPDTSPGGESAAADTAPNEAEKKIDIFAPYRKRAEEKLLTMTLEQKIGQLLLVRCPTEGTENMIRELQPGGLVLFGRDFADKSAEEVRQTLESYQEAAITPLLLATDEEGGTVCRVSSNPKLRTERFSSPQQVYAAGGLEAVRADGAEKAALLLGLGVNLNLAPVADLPDTTEDYIYPRSLGLDRDQTAAYVATAVESMQTGGLSTCLKHFPGYGPNPNTHTGAAYDQRPLSSFLEFDLLSFAAGINAGAHCILVSHNTVTAMDDMRPASLSPAVHEILRDKLGFTGVVITDDLDMEAIQAYNGEQPATVLAVQAGNDMMILSDAAGALADIRAAVDSGGLKETDIDQAALRVLSLKYAMGLLK